MRREALHRGRRHDPENWLGWPQYSAGRSLGLVISTDFYQRGNSELCKRWYCCTAEMYVRPSVGAYVCFAHHKQLDEDEPIAAKM